VSGVGLATVDRVRAADSLAGLAFIPEPEEPLLGAYVLAAGLPDGTTLRLLEPSTEGRLAAFLARHGEGPAALYLETAAGEKTAPDGSASGGPGVLLRSGGRSGPFLIAWAGAPAPQADRTASPRHPSAGTIPSMPEPEVVLRSARGDDAEAIAALFTEEGYPAGPSDIVERLERFDSPYSTVQVAEIGGEVVAFVAVHILPRFEHSDRIGRVLALVVDAGARERGLGHRLMMEAERVSVAAGCAYLEVTAGHHRPEAQSLYESLGYEAGVTTYLRKRL
jgi:ribosomal protein S18 acetylase RimI-like enzyme